MHPLWTAVSIAPLAACIAAQGAPIKIKSSKWLGNVTSTNTNFGRDLGFQGKIGNCWINSFGDDFKCDSANPQRNCDFSYITARNSCGQPESPTSYKDIFLKDGKPKQCVPNVFIESNTNPAGITNAISTGPNSGIIYVLAGDATVFDPSVSKIDTKFLGAGFATVEVSDDCKTFTVDRTQANHWYGNLAGNGNVIYNEAFYGDHGALHAQDGYLYVYGTIPGSIKAAGSNLALARVKPNKASDLDSYQYWNGKAFQKERILNPTPDIAVLDSISQGSVFWNNHLGRYIYMTSLVHDVFIRTARNPWGPWSKETVNLFNVNQMPYRFEPALGSIESLYSPAIQHKYSDDNGKSMVFWVTYFVENAINDDKGTHQVITAVEVHFE